MNNFIRLKWSSDFAAIFPVLLMALLIALALPGCATVGGPVKAAETVEQRAFAAYGTFVVFEESAVSVIQNTSLPRGIRLAAQNADRKAKPLADSLLDATLEAQRVRLQVAAGTNTVERLVIVTAELEDWIVRAEPIIDELVRAVRTGGG